MSSPNDSTSAAVISVSVDDAREAYVKRDVQASIDAHDRKLAALQDPAAEQHGVLGDNSSLLKSLVLGGIDGAVTTFTVIASGVGTELTTEQVLAMAISKVIADAISMAISDTMSENSELQYAVTETNREKWEMASNLPGEIEEMTALYSSKYNIPHDKAYEILKAMSDASPDLFLRHMMQLELGLEPAEEEGQLRESLKNGGVTFLSFVVFGAIPIIAYAIMYGADYNDKWGMFGISAAFTALALGTLGAVSAHLTRISFLYGAGVMMINGSLAAAAAYLISWGLDEALRVEDSI